MRYGDQSLHRSSFRKSLTQQSLVHFSISFLLITQHPDISNAIYGNDAVFLGVRNYHQLGFHVCLAFLVLFFFSPLFNLVWFDKISYVLFIELYLA